MGAADMATTLPTVSGAVRTASIDLAVTGMTCASCAARIEKRLNRLAGAEATVNYATEIAHVRYDPAAVSASDLVAAVESVGYGAVLPTVVAEPVAGARVESAAERHVAELRQRLVVSAILAAPALALSMIPPLQFRNWQWLVLTLASPVVVWGALPFHRAALVTAAGSQIGATLGLALPALWLWPARMPGASAWLALLAVGVVCTGIAYILFFRLIENAGPPRALAVTFLVSVFAVLYGALFLGESVTPWMVGCAGVIVGGTALSTGLLKPGRKRTQAR